MTKKELLEFVKKTGMLQILPEEKRKEVLSAIEGATDEKLPEVEKQIKDIYGKQKALSVQYDNLESQAKILEQKAQKLYNKYQEGQESKAEEAEASNLFKQI